MLKKFEDGWNLYQNGKAINPVPLDDERMNKAIKDGKLKSFDTHTNKEVDIDLSKCRKVRCINL